MQLAITIVSALVSLAGLAFKWWKAKKDASEFEKERDRWKALASHMTSENVTLRTLVAKKETQLATAQAALAAKLTASELASALNELFRGEPAAAGRGAEQPGPAVPSPGKTGT